MSSTTGNDQQNVKCTVYCRPDHFSCLEVMRERDELCDVTIQVNMSYIIYNKNLKNYVFTIPWPKVPLSLPAQNHESGIFGPGMVEDQSFRAHKVILATVNYFRKMFISNFQERDKDIITLKGVSAASIASVITFAYTGKITLTEENAHNIMKDADYFGLVDVKDDSAEFLKSCINLGNVLRIYNVAESLLCSSLKEKAYKFIQDNFLELSQIKEYSNMSFSLLKDILSSKDIQAISQKKIFEAIMNWIRDDIDNRKIYLPDLIIFIRLSEIDVEYFIVYFYKDETAAKTDKLKELITDFMSCYYNANKQRLLDSIDDTSSIAGKILVADWCNSSTIEIYDSSTEKWVTTIRQSNLLKLIHGPTFFGCTVLKNKLYTAGGELTTSSTQQSYLTATVYESETQTWKSIASMEYKRSFPGVAALNGFVYVCGGYDGMNHTKHVERYCPETDEWKTMSSMNCARSALALVAFEGYLFALGGWNGVFALDTIEQYDPKCDQWVILPIKMQDKRCDFGGAVLKGKLYVCGGSCSNFYPDTLKSVEVYNPQLQKFEYVASMDSTRYYHTVVATNGKLYAIGGLNSTKSDLSTIEVYDPETNSWSYGPPMTKISGPVIGGVLSI